MLLNSVQENTKNEGASSEIWEEEREDKHKVRGITGSWMWLGHFSGCDLGQYVDAESRSRHFRDSPNIHHQNMQARSFPLTAKPYWKYLFYCCLGAKSCLDSLVNPRTVTCQAPLTMGFSRQEYWSGLPFPSLGDLSDQGLKLRFLHWQMNSLLMSQ